MQYRKEKQSGPLVSILLPTYNRRRYLPSALASAVDQSYTNIEIIVVRDGGEDVGDIVRSFNDPRIRYIDRDTNRGKAFSLNEALELAQGEYIAYLDDDDIFYPDHIQTLVDALERETDCLLAYTDLYRTYCRLRPQGQRDVLSKVLEVSRDFDRFVMLYFNHTLHVSLMHHRRLLEKTGPYNEQLEILIDWDFTRKAVFYTDFYHIPRLTGEYFSPLGPSDRISFRQRTDHASYLRNAMTIRSTRPPKPWPKLKDLAIVLLFDRFDAEAGRTITEIWRHTFYPYRLYLPLTDAEAARLNTDMPNLVIVPLERACGSLDRLDAALQRCDAELVAAVPANLPIEQFWLEDSLYALATGDSAVRGAFELEASTEHCWAVVATREDLQQARSAWPQLPLRQCLERVGVTIRRVLPEQIPFQLDQSLAQARLASQQGRWRKAAVIYQYAAGHYGNELWMNSLAAEALFHAGDHENALQLIRQVNAQRPTIQTLLLEARVHRLRKDFRAAIPLLEQAERILEGQTRVWA